jgi:hypothetical protein
MAEYISIGQAYLDDGLGRGRRASIRGLATSSGFALSQGSELFDASLVMNGSESKWFVPETLVLQGAASRCQAFRSSSLWRPRGLRVARRLMPDDPPHIVGCKRVLFEKIDERVERSLNGRSVCPLFDIRQNYLAALTEFVD